MSSDHHNAQPKIGAGNPGGEHTVLLGDRQVWGGEEPFGLSRRDRRQHTYCVGKTGTGKTTLLRNLILQDIYAGEGVTVIDPHGDLAEELLDYIPRWRTDHLVYFNPADHEYPVALNLLQPGPTERQHLIASGLVGCFKSIWRDSWGPRLEYLLFACVAALLDCPNTSLLGVPRMLTDSRYRLWVIEQCQDPVVKAFWQEEFAGYDRRFLSEVISPVQNKVGQLLMAAPVRNILGQVKSKIDLRFVLDNRRILIANLAKGRLGEDKANLLGAVLVAQLQLAALQRASVPEGRRVDHYCYVDEFHNFTTDSFATILSEARKYRLCLHLSHQFTAQLQPSIRDAVFGNVANLISFRVGESDAAILEREIGGGYRARHFTELSNHHVCCKVLEAGAHDEPFLARTHPPLFEPHDRRQNLIRRSRERFATPRAVVEERIERWMRRKEW